MKLINIEAFDIPDAWYQCLQKTIEYGRDYKIEKGSYEGLYRKELDYVTINILNPSVRPLIPIIPPTLGIQPPTSMEYVNTYFETKILSPIVEEYEDYTYGERIEISVYKIIDILKNTPNTNQAIIQIGKPDDIDLVDPPCLRHLDLKIIDNKLNMYIYFRSWDLWGGLPSNLAGFQLLKEYLCDQIGCEDGEMICSSKGLHLYDYAWDFAKTRTYL